MKVGLKGNRGNFFPTDEREQSQEKSFCVLSTSLLDFDPFNDLKSS